MGDTKKHISNVRVLLETFSWRLGERAREHDRSKLREPERSLFERYEDRLSDVEYDSEEYWAMMEELKPAIEHHWENNRHHPEYFENGIEDMNLLDIVEMTFDWFASSQRHDDGDVKESIDKNKERFGLSDQLVAIMKNTAEEFEDEIQNL